MSTNTTFVNQWIKRLPIALILLAVVMALSYAFVNLQPVVRFGSVGTTYESSIQSGIDADAARYTAMADFYTAKRKSIQFGIDANAAQYTAMAVSYSAWRDALKQIHDADAARYSAMAKYYTEK